MEYWIIFFLTSFSMSFLAATAIIAFRNRLGEAALDGSTKIQRLHEGVTPRIGGAAVALGLFIALAVSARAEMAIVSTLIATSLPAFLAGNIEDLTGKVGVRVRLYAALSSGLLFAVISGYRIEHLGIPGVDWILSMWLPAVLLTAFAIGGVVHAFNIIDGLNGLASGTALIALAGLTMLSWFADDTTMFGMCLVTAGAVLGFFVLNFPRGLIFLGDGGAYLLGFVLAAFAVMLPARNPEISPMVGLLVLSYPVIETLVSMTRRARLGRGNMGRPDCLHLHSLMFKATAQYFDNAGWRISRSMTNGLAALATLSIPLLSLPLVIVLASSFWGILAGVGFMYLYFYGLYRLLQLPPTVAEASETPTERHQRGSSGHLFSHRG